MAAALGLAALALLFAGPARAETPATGAPVGGIQNPDPFFGVTSAAVGAAGFETMAAGGVGAFRVPLPWPDIQPRRHGRLDWSRFDQVVAQTAVNGIELLPFVYATPRWMARNWRRLPVRNRHQLRHWKRFLRAAVRRYGHNGGFWFSHPDLPYRPIETWQVWNEPNIRTFARPVSSRRYARLLRASYRAIGRVDPASDVMLAGLYGTPHRIGVGASRFLTRLYRRRSFRHSFDIAAIHPYGADTRKSMRMIRRMRRVLDRHHDRRTPIAVTEIGWNSGFNTPFGTGSPAAQAHQVTSIFRAMLNNRRRLDLESVYWFTWMDTPLDVRTCSFCRQSGLFDSDNLAKPAWDAMKGLIAGR